MPDRAAQVSAPNSKKKSAPAGKKMNFFLRPDKKTDTARIYSSRAFQRTQARRKRIPTAFKTRMQMYIENGL
jgi:hypothetical protein